MSRLYKIVYGRESLTKSSYYVIVGSVVSILSTNCSKIVYIVNVLCSPTQIIFSILMRLNILFSDYSSHTVSYIRSNALNISLNFPMSILTYTTRYISQSQTNSSSSQSITLLIPFSCIKCVSFQNFSLSLGSIFSSIISLLSNQISIQYNRVTQSS